ncbi:cation transporter [Vibrio sp. WXL210]|uniref:cation transporter n=1 Tax=Vibrio sp. WXL210 TaxID=3450709 RepID=UPI003EC4C5AF
MFSDKRLLTSLTTIAADVLLTMLRVGLAYITGSSALMADAYHSITDLSTSIIFLVCMLIRVWQDKTGNPTRMRIAKYIESWTVIIASIIILFIPYRVVSNARQYSSDNIENIWIGIFGVIFIIVCVFAIARLKTYVGRKTGSISLEADGYHSMVDLFTSIAVLISLVGLLIGIDLEQLVAVVIAVLIGVSGVELLISGITSLFNSTRVEPISLFELFKTWYKNKRHTWRLFDTTAHYGHWIIRKKYPLIFASIAIYLTTGFVQVGLGQQAIIQLFERTVYIQQQPGLAYALPWPFGRVIPVSSGDIRSVIIGSTASDYTRRNGRRMWLEIHANRVSRDDSSYIQTGDDNLLFLQLEVQYRLTEPAISYFDFDDIDSLVKRASEAVLWRQVAMSHYSDLLATSYDQFASQLQQKLSESLEQLALPVQVQGIFVQNLQPPAALVSIYRDVVNAHQDSEDQVNQAISQSFATLPLVRAQVTDQLGRAKADSIDTLWSAQGDSARYALLSEQFKANQVAFSFEQYIKAMTESLTGKELIIADPRFDKRDYRVWKEQHLQPVLFKD